MAQKVIQTGLPDRDGRFLLHSAVLGGSVAFLAHLLGSRVFSTNSRDHSGRTALSYAAQVGRQKAVVYLRARDDVDLNRTDNRGVNGLINAA